MPLRVSEIRLPLDGDEAELVPRLCRRTGLAEDEIATVVLVRKSLDRRRRRPELVYTFDVHLREGVTVRARDAKMKWVDPLPDDELSPGNEALDHPPVVIGAGPAGLFAALVLARHGYRPVILERGARMNERVRHVEAFHRRSELELESNYLFGEGGAGTFSDGKLTTRSKDPRARRVLDEFRERSGRDYIGTYYRPHLGSDRIRAVVGNMRLELESLGAVFHYGVRVERLRHADGRLSAVSTSAGEMPARAVICAPGHSARDFYEALRADGVPLERKPFQMGFRVEHPQDMINRSLYGRKDAHPSLGHADYRLATRAGPDSVFSFCMCPGGEIIPAVHDAAHFNTNGMSYFKKDTGFANSGIVTTVEPEAFGGDSDDVLAGLRLQQLYERRAAELAGPRFVLPSQRLDDFMAGRPSEAVPPTSCRTGERPADVARLVPPAVLEAVRHALGVFDRQLPGYLGPEGVICGPEARSSSPVRILRDEQGFSPGVDGLLPVGEGAGYAGGIVSAAVDGWRAAEAVIRRFRR